MGNGFRWGQAATRRAAIASMLLAALVVLAALPVGARAAGVTNGGSDLRDGWYGNQPALGHDAVASSDFDQLWDQDKIVGEVHAQPLVHNGRVVIATESNRLYSLDASTGAITWSVTLPGEPWKTSDASCSDVVPTIGATATPVIDPSTDTIYLTHKAYASGTSGAAKIWLDAYDATTGAKRSNFPVEFAGAAQNFPDQTFQPTMQMQRPGLLLMDGVVYAAFGGVCDRSPYKGWVFGVSTAGQIRARWTAVHYGNGAGIWQSGSGLMSDGPGRIFLSTGNSGSPPPPLAGNTAGNGWLGESVVHLDVLNDGTLATTDFFAPSDAAELDTWDADFASGGVTSLPDGFGTTTYPKLAVAVGKAGYVYLLNRDDLGGIGMGPSGGDRTVARIGPHGGVWARPAVWRGDGGYVYIPTASQALGQDTGSAGYLDVYKRLATNGVPTLTRVAQSQDSFGFGSSSAVVTSDATTNGSGLVWLTWMAAGDGLNAELRVYDAVPGSDKLQPLRTWSIGRAAKFTPPGVGNGKVYVATRDGHVRAFGAPAVTNLKATGLSFADPVTIGGSASHAVHLTASTDLTVTGVSTSAGDFSAASDGLGLPATLTAGETLDVPVTFTPTKAGTRGGQLTVDMTVGGTQKTSTFALTGTGQVEGPSLGCAPVVLPFDGVLLGQDRTESFTICNQGNQPMTIEGIDAPAAPFSIENAPAALTDVAPGESVPIELRFAPQAVDNYSSQIVVRTTGGDHAVGLTGRAVKGPNLVIDPAALDFGNVTVGAALERAVTLSNTGDAAAQITKSKLPFAPFAGLDALDEGTTIAPGASRTLHLRFAPTATGTFTDTWTLNVLGDAGVRTIALSGTGVVAAPDGGTTDPGPGTSPDPGPGPSILTPDPPGPPLPRVSATLHVKRPALSRSRRTLTVSGTLAKAATGKVTATLSAKVKRKTVKATKSVRPKAGRFTIKLTLPKALRGLRKASLKVSFAGDAKVKAQALRAVTVKLRR